MEIKARPFRLALLQLASLTGNKKNNINVARAAVLAASKSTPKPDLIVLPEIWNSPYAVPKFREYSEPVPEVGSDGKGGEGEGETISALREMAKEAGCWLIGGKSRRVWESSQSYPFSDVAEANRIGSIPEIEESTDSVYNTATVYDPQGRSSLSDEHHMVSLTNQETWWPSTVKSTYSISTSQGNRLSRYVIQRWKYRIYQT